MMTLDRFWMGRDTSYATALSPAIRDNAMTTIIRANRLIGIYQRATGDIRERDVASGWRPPEINAATPGAAAKSKHMTGEAVDVADASRSLKRWLMTSAGQDALAECELWMEHPDSTPSWVHVQIVPPASGRRVFYP